MPDNTFEKVFADLAHASLRDRAPQLMEHMVGFQLLDKNDEDTHAVGVFGFKVGKQWYYAPMFFLNGQLKGDDLLYVKDQDLFVPLQDNWINYLVSKQPYLLGNPDETSESELGIQAPNLDIFSETPDSGGSKWASVKEANMRPWARDFVRVYERFITDSFHEKYAQAIASIRLNRFLNDYPQAVVPLIKSMQKSAALASAVNRFYDLDKLLPDPRKVAAAIHKVQDNRGEEDMSIKGDGIDNVTVVTQEDLPDLMANAGSEELTDSEKERLLKDEVVVRDKRNNTTTVYNSDYNRKLTNPTESGVYDVLSRNGGFDKFLVCTEPKTIGDGAVSNISLLVGGPKGQYGAFDSRDVFISQTGIGTSKETDAFDSKEYYNKAKSLDSMKPGGLYVLLTADGDVSLPFKFLKADTGSSGFTTYAVYMFVSYGSVHRIGGNTRMPEATVTLKNDDIGGNMNIAYSATYYESNKKTPFDNYELERARFIVTTDKRVNGMRQSDKSTIVNEDNAKVLELAAPFEDVSSRNVKVFNPGTLADVEAFITKNAHPIMVYRDGPHVLLGSEFGTKRLTKRAMLKHLIVDWGMAEADARYIEKHASRKAAQYFVKEAQGTLLNAANIAPSMPSYDASYSSTAGVPVFDNQVTHEEVNSLPTGTEEDYDITKDEEVMKAMDAANKGQRDIFDAGMLRTLTKVVDVDDIIDKMLPSIIQGMNNLGKVLYMYYWHNDHFQERYGKQDLLDLEDGLRNTFSSVGDLVLFLKQKTIEPNPGLNALDITLENMI